VNLITINGISETGLLKKEARNAEKRKENNGWKKRKIKRKENVERKEEDRCIKKRKFIFL
jgi:hypothetical protein